MGNVKSIWLQLDVNFFLPAIFNNVMLYRFYFAWQYPFTTASCFKPGVRPVFTWFLEISFVREVGMCVYVCLCVYVCVCVFVCVSVCAYVHACVRACLYVCLSVCLY